MYRIVENLFSNISKYALENSRVYIDIIKKSNEVYIEMKNISKEKLNLDNGNKYENVDFLEVINQEQLREVDLGYQ